MSYNNNQRYNWYGSEEIAEKEFKESLIEEMEREMRKHFFSFLAEVIDERSPSKEILTGELARLPQEIESDFFEDEYRDRDYYDFLDCKEEKEEKYPKKCPLCYIDHDPKLHYLEREEEKELEKEKEI